MILFFFFLLKKVIHTPEASVKFELKSDPYHFTPMEVIGKEEASLWVNDDVDVRELDDKFGRKITELRKQLTRNDSQPFPTK